MACPFFMPERRHDAELWQFRHRLPLGDGFTGFCSLRGQSHLLSAEELREHCNVGYARHCPWIPADRPSDSVRFAVAWEREDSILLHYACEREYLPTDCGTVEYSRILGLWSKPHANACIQRMAECYLKSFLRKKGVQPSSETWERGRER